MPCLPVALRRRQAVGRQGELALETEQRLVRAQDFKDMNGITPRQQVDLSRARMAEDTGVEQLDPDGVRRRPGIAVGVFQKRIDIQTVLDIPDMDQAVLVGPEQVVADKACRTCGAVHLSRSDEARGSPPGVPQRFAADLLILRDLDEAPVVAMADARKIGVVVSSVETIDRPPSGKGGPAP